MIIEINYTLNGGLSAGRGEPLPLGLDFSPGVGHGWYDDRFSAWIRFCLYNCSTRHSDPLPMFCVSKR